MQHYGFNLIDYSLLRFLFLFVLHLLGWKGGGREYEREGGKEREIGSRLIVQASVHFAT